MAKTLILGKTEPEYITDLGFKFVALGQFNHDEERHDFIIELFGSNEIEKLIILIDIQDSYEELRLGYHVRLTVSLHKQRLVPIWFICSDTLSVVLDRAGTWGRILTTKGCRLIMPNKEEIQSTFIRSLEPEELSLFLNLIQLRPDESIGRHSLANQWGAYVLDKAAGTRALVNNQYIIKARKQIYFKYIEASNYKPEQLKRNPIRTIDLPKKPERIEVSDRKILLIDDEAAKGWGDVLRVLFKTTHPETHFQVIDKRLSGWESLTDEEKKIIQQGDIDLFLIDLRLSGSEEEDNVYPDSFSGADILRKIKAQNAANQVIIFTASNKAWNLKRLLEAGADGYYIKESPEYNFSENFSYENFKNFKREAERCFEYGFLRKIWLNHEAAKKHLENLSALTNDKAQYNQLISQLDIAYKLLQIRHNLNCSHFIVNYVQILELIANKYIVSQRGVSPTYKDDNQSIAYCFWDESVKNYELQRYDTSYHEWEYYRSISNRIIAISLQKLGFTPVNDSMLLKRIYSLIKKRNDFIHNRQRVPLISVELCDWSELIKKILTRL